MSEDRRGQLEKILQRVTPSRRDLLKGLLLGSGALALLAPASAVLSAQDQGGDGKGKKGKGKGGTQD